MRFAVTVQAMMKQNLIAFLASGDPDIIYRFLTAELLECEPADLLLLHDLLKREITDEEETTRDKLIELSKRFFRDMRDVLYGILTDHIATYKEAKDFLPLGQILGQALAADPKVFHEIGMMIFNDYYTPEIIERAQKSSLYKYHDEIDEHFRTIQKRTEEGKENEGTDQIHEVPDWHHPAKAEIRMIRLIDVVSCYIDANPENLL